MLTRMNLAVAAAAAPLVPCGPFVREGLEAIRQDVRDELKWLEGLDAGALVSFMEQRCPATLLLIAALGDKLSRAEAPEKEDLRTEIADLVSDRVYLYRDYENYRQRASADQAATCLRIFALEDMKVLAEMDVVRLEGKAGKPADIAAKRREIADLDNKIDAQYDRLEKKP